MKTRRLFEEAAGSGCLAMAGLVPDGGAALVGAGLFLTFKNRFKDADERALQSMVKRVVEQARNELKLFYRPDGAEWEQMLEENDARRVVMDHLRFALPTRERIIQTRFDVDVLTTETVERLAQMSSGAIDLSEPGSRPVEIARAHVRALLKALEAERDFLKGLEAELTLEIARDVKEMREDLRAIADQMSADKHVSVDVLRTIARRFDRGVKGEWTREDLLDFLSDKADEYRQLIDSIARVRNVSPEITRLRDVARQALETGELDAARALLKQAREAQTRLREDQEAEAAKRRAEAAQRRAEEVELLTEEAQAAALALDYGPAGELYLRAVDLRSRDDADAAAKLAFDSAYSFSKDSERLGDNGGLEQAIALHDRCLALKAKKVDPIGWGATQNNLGIVLEVLGARRGDEALLARAGEAYEAALTVRTRDSIPVDWAMTQNNLGSVLRALGEWRADEALLARAGEAYEAALTVYSRDATPVDWAMTQNNLGGVLQALGDRRDDAALLARALEAYGAALTVYSHDATPVDWAVTQNNLGSVLRALGERRGDEALLARAVEAYEAALTVRTRDAAPVGWAKTQDNLGSVLRALGERRGDEALLARAVEAYEAALTVHTRDAAPVGWAMTQNNLGNVLGVLGQRRGDKALLARAVEAREAALDMFLETGHITYADITRENLAQAALDALRGSTP